MIRFHFQAIRRSAPPNAVGHRELRRYCPMVPVIFDGKESYRFQLYEPDSSGPLRPKAIANHRIPASLF